MDLTEIEIVQGGLSLIITIIYFIVGLKIVLKYFTYKRKELITMGFTIMLMSGHPIYALSFVTYVLFDFTIGLVVFMMVTLTLVLLAIMCWIYTFSIIIYPNQAKKFVLMHLIACVLLEIFLIYFLLTDPAIVAIELGKFDVQVNFFGLVVIGYALLMHIILVSVFCYKSLKSKDAELKWRGLFILIGAISFIFGQAIEIRATLVPLIILARIIVISCAIAYYIGWIIPKRIANWLVKDDVSVVSIEQKDEVQDFLKILSRPKKLTEEEVTFYKEKKICLVCKGKVGGFMFMCNSCDALYCGNCAQALSNLENACWVCDGPIDESKPVRSYKDEEEAEIKISETKTKPKKGPKKK